MHLRPPRAGALLVATPVLTDPNFARSVVLLLRHDDEGSLGVVLDRPTTIPVDEFLPAWADLAAPPAVVFHGGPVEPEIGIGIALRSDSLETVQLDSDPRDTNPVRIFAGYAGWGPGQLEDEMLEDAWFALDFHPSDLLIDTPQELWTFVLRRQPANLSIFATYPSDLRMN
jgi:putative transcriptional regulator